MRWDGLKRGLALLWLACLLVGCSGYQLAYNNLDHLILGRVDKRLDLNADQKRDLGEQLQLWHKQHRAEQLPEYRSLLELWRELTLGPPLTPLKTEQQLDRVGALWFELRKSAERPVTGLLQSLDSGQKQRLLRYLRDNIEKRRTAYLEKSPRQRSDRRFELYQKRLKRWIGRLTEEQQNRLRHLIVELSDRHLQWLQYRARWTDALERVLDAGAEREALGKLILNPQAFRDDALQRSMDKNRQRWTRFLAELANQLSDTQRNHLLGELDGLIEDADSLTGSP